MKKNLLFIIKGVILAVLILLSADRVGAIMATIEKMVNVDKTEDCDIAFVGSSHVYRGINPQLIYDETGLTSVNLSTSSQTIMGSYWILRGYLEKHHPQVVFIDVHPTPSGAREAYTLWTMHEYDVLKYMAYKDLKNPEFDISDASRFLAYRTQYNSIDKADFDYINGKGIITSDHWFNAIYSQTTELTEEDVKNCYEQPSGYDVEEQLEYVEKIIKLAEDKGITPVLITAPYLIKKDDEEYYKMLSKYANEHGVTFLNFNDTKGDIYFDLKCDFSDIDHLSYEGGNKYTEYLAEYITDEMGIVHDSGKHISEIWEKYRRHYQYTYDLINIEGDELLDRLDCMRNLSDDYVQMIVMSKDNYDACSESEKNLLSEMGINPDFSQGQYLVVVKIDDMIKTVYGMEEAKIYDNIEGVACYVERSDEGGVIRVGTNQVTIAADDGLAVCVYCVSYNKLLASYIN